MPFFCYLLGKALHQSRHTRAKEQLNWQRVFCLNVTKLGLTVILTFVLCWLPFILTGGDGGAQLLRRLFPFGRGLYEDKVANFWCSISMLLKVRQLFSRAFLIKLSFLVTLVSLLPSSIGLLRRPSPYNFLLALVSYIYLCGKLCAVPALNWQWGTGHLVGGKKIYLLLNKCV